MKQKYRLLIALFALSVALAVSPAHSEYPGLAVDIFGGEFSWNGVSGCYYQTETCDNLVDWIPMGPVFPGSDATFVQPIDYNDPRRYYRVSISDDFNSPNLLTNAGFESGSTSPFIPTSSTLDISTGEVRGGAFSALSSGRDRSSDGVSYRLHAPLILQPGETYEISAWVRLSSNTSGVNFYEADQATVELVVDQNDDSGRFFHSLDSRVATNTGWTQLKGFYTFRPVGTLTSSKLTIRGPYKGIEFYVDDVVVKKLTTAPFQPGTIYPQNGDSSVPLDAWLSWTPGPGAPEHDIYLGTDFNEVSQGDPGVYQGRVTAAPDPATNTFHSNCVFEPVLSPSTTYHWRVDPINSQGSQSGIVSSFTTRPLTEPNLIGWWKFDEDSGSTAFDSSGHGHHGTATGTSFKIGQIGRAYGFNGADHVTIPSAVFATVDKEISICLWQFGDPSIQPQSDSVFEGDNAAGDRVLNAHIPWSSETIFWDAGNDGTFDRIEKVADDAADYAGQWNHWVFTKNADTGDMKIYLNGVLWHSDTGKTKAIQGITDFKIGSRADGTLSYDGNIDDFRIYDRELTAVEIGELYDTGAHSHTTRTAKTITLAANSAEPAGLTESDSSGMIKFTGAGSLTWQLHVPKAGDYEVTLPYAAWAGAGSDLTVTSGASEVTGVVSANDSFYSNANLKFDRAPLKGKLTLPGGHCYVTLTLSNPAGNPALRLAYLELNHVDDKADAIAEVKRARQARADTQWFRDSLYGLMFHWTPASQPLSGPQLSYPDAVNAFDVTAFCKMVEEAGAGHVMFTLSHAPPSWCPAPIAAWETYHPGLTTSRDLVMEMANGLAAKGIDLMLYLPSGSMLGVSTLNTGDFTRAQHEIMTAIGTRYGSKVKGYWFDNWSPNTRVHPGFSNEQFFYDCKAGYADRIICLNTWILPICSPWQEYWASEGTGPAPNNLPAVPVIPYGSAKGLQFHHTIVFEQNWVHDDPNTPIPAPKYSAATLINYINQLETMGGVVTFNPEIYQDGTISQQSLDVLKAVKAAVRP